MIELTGKFNSTKIFTDVVDSASIAQVQQLLNQPFSAGQTIRMMPDIHAGVGCTIGTTMTVTDKVVPNLVGVDIGCGMEVVQLKEKHIELQKLDKVIRERVPAGFSKRSQAHRYLDHTRLEELRCRKQVDLPHASISLGTLGGGNHFIEADRDEDGALYLVVHSGSRHLGLEVAKYYQDAAFRQCKEQADSADAELIARLKAEGRQADIPKELAALRKTMKPAIPRELSYLSGELLDDYLWDMRIVQEFAEWNRRAMTDEIVKGMGFHVVDTFTTIHNYIDVENRILRKGAVSAQAGEKLIIPINMRDGSLICIGKGNPDWNCSALHGAGRLMSRSEAKESFTVSQFKKEMKDVYSTSVNASTLDECPMAYKDMESITGNIGPTAEVVKVIRPIYNFKAGNED